jgi:hypothetical protein
MPYGVQNTTVRFLTVKEKAKLRSMYLYLTTSVSVPSPLENPSLGILVAELANVLGRRPGL